jgi:hypothetical protein
VGPQDTARRHVARVARISSSGIGRVGGCRRLLGPTGSPRAWGRRSSCRGGSPDKTNHYERHRQRSGVGQHVRGLLSVSSLMPYECPA